MCTDTYKCCLRLISVLLYKGMVVIPLVVSANTLSSRTRSSNQYSACIQTPPYSYSRPALSPVSTQANGSSSLFSPTAATSLLVNHLLHSIPIPACPISIPVCPIPISARTSCRWATLRKSHNLQMTSVLAHQNSTVFRLHLALPTAIAERSLLKALDFHSLFLRTMMV